MRLYDEPPPPDKFGSDPREGLEPEELEPDSTFKIAAPGALGNLETIQQLQTAIAAAGDKQLVSVKFVRKNCAACASTVEVYEAAAKEFGAAGQFYTADFDVRHTF